MGVHDYSSLLTSTPSRDTSSQFNFHQTFTPSIIIVAASADPKKKSISFFYREYYCMGIVPVVECASAVRIGSFSRVSLVVRR
jgi:hypothetical protein